MLALALTLTLGTSFNLAHTSAQDIPCDDAAIEWVLPGSFEAALERAKEENRILLIKGVSFGIDVAGAKCATEGTW